MNRFALSAVALAAITGTSAAQAAVTVVGNSLARTCYEAAVDEQAAPSTIRTCNRALGETTLMRRDRVATLVNRGILHVQMGDYAAGIADYNSALALDDRQPEAYLNKALAILRRDGPESDLLPSLFDRAIELGTREPAIAYYARGVVNELAGDIPGAYRDLLRAAELDPEWELPRRDLMRFRVVEDGRNLG